MSPDLAPLFAELLEPPPALRLEDAAAWCDAFRRRSAASPVACAIRGGASADRLGWAFAAGYQAALQALIPEHPPARVAALLVTEHGPPHPRSIETRWDGEALVGEKRFVTLGAHAEVLYVLAREGVEQGRARLALVRVAADAAGIALEELPAAPFVPEVPHAAVRFAGTPGERLPGDGWSDWARPFRTVEDAHVHVAALSFLTACLGRWGGAEAARERGVALVASLAALAACDPSHPATHVALAGALAEARAWWDGVDRAGAPEEDRVRLERDRRLLAVASSARDARRARAWSRLGGGSGS